MSKNKVQVTNFSRLLKAFHISGMEMAEVLHVDSSLISKWKTNKRKFRGNSLIFEQLIEYIMSLDKASEYLTLRKLLLNDYPDSENADKDRLKIYLKKWLVKAVDVEIVEASVCDYISSEKTAELVTLYKLQGNRGKQEGVLTLLRMGLALEEPQEIWCSFDKSQTWFWENENYLSEWMELNKKFLDDGNEIYVIHPMNRRMGQLEKSLLIWLPLYLTGKVYPFFYEERYGGYLEKSCMVLKNHAMLFQYYVENGRKDDATYITDDKETVQGVFDVLQRQAKSASPCFKRFYDEDGQAYMEFLANIVKLPESQYLYMRFPFVNMIPIAEMEEILADNDVDVEKRGKVLEACQKLKNDLRRDGDSHFRYLIPKNAIEELLKEEKIYLDTVSLFCGKPVYISNQHFRTLVGRLSAVLTHVNTHTKIHEVTLIDNNWAQMIGNLNILCKNDTCASVFNDPRELTDDVPWVLTTIELPIVKAIYGICHHIWETTFQQNRDNEMIARQLQIMMQTVPEPENKES